MKIILENKFYFFPALWKITVGGFVNQLIKNSGLTDQNNNITILYLYCLHTTRN